MPGFQTAPDRAGYQFLMVLITELFSVTLGQAVAAITPSPCKRLHLQILRSLTFTTVIRALLNPFLIITFALFCGVTIPGPQIPAFWRAWLFQLDPFTRLVSGMVVTELHGRPVVCAASGSNHFNAPAGQTCGEYMNEFFTVGNGAGYLVDNATSSCSYCAYKVYCHFDIY